MIEITIKEFVEQRISAPLFFEYPKEAPGRFVILKMQTDPREEFLESAILVADSYAPSLLEAMRLNEEVKNALDALSELDCIAGSHRGGDYPFPDTANKRRRYQAVQNITHY